STAGRRRRAGGGLAGMLLGELQQMAASMGISGTARMRKGDLIAAIEKGQAEGRVPRARATSAATATEPAAATATERAPAEPARGEAPAPAEEAPAERRPRRASRPAGPPEPREDRVEVEAVAGGVRAAGRGEAEPGGRTDER